MSKQLRLDVAQLSDVGRKRPHNEDNADYVIPDDTEVMEREGALFIVADGMGGHAAGEVASEIAVDTVKSTYYQHENDDLSASLEDAIKRANVLIHQRAAENMLRSGMGTTCVSAVLRGERVYIANVGDSRAYLIQNGQMRQLSQDHSWVAEQVRAGLLTEEQARSHAQRNVITRSLGTQPAVEIDIFCEQVQEGDTIVLCSDGLSGLIADDELCEIASTYPPKDSVYRLVERANANGGPDNITVIVIRVLEVGTEPPVRYPVRIGGREEHETDGQEITTVLTPISLEGTPARSDNERVLSAPLPLPDAPLPLSDYATAPQPVVPSKYSRLRRYRTLAIICILLLVTLLGSGIYYWLQINTFEPPFQNARSLINQAKGEVVSNPTEALRKLAAAQQSLSTLQQGLFTPTQHHQVAMVLQEDLNPTVQLALTNYNHAAKIIALPCTTTTMATIIPDSSAFRVSGLALIPSPDTKANTIFSYVLGQDHALYQLNEQQHSLVKRLPSTSQVLSIASDHTHLLALTAAQQGNAPASYTLSLFTPNGEGVLNVTGSTTIDSSFTRDGQVPTFLTTWGSDVYVVLTATASAAQNTAMLLDYPISMLTKPPTSVKPVSASISITTPLLSVVAFPNHQLFLLDSSGRVQSLLFTPGKPTASTVVLADAIAPALALTAKDVSMGTPVPTPSAPYAIFLSVPRAALLAADSIDNTPHLYVTDEQHQSILDLTVVDTASSTLTPIIGNGTVTTTSTAFKMRAVQQFASASLLTQVQSMAVDPKAARVSLLVQSPQNAAAFVLISMDVNPKDTCST